MIVALAPSLHVTHGSHVCRGRLGCLFVGEWILCVWVLIGKRSLVFDGWLYEWVGNLFDGLVYGMTDQLIRCVVYYVGEFVCLFVGLCII